MKLNKVCKKLSASLLCLISISLFLFSSCISGKYAISDTFHSESGYYFRYIYIPEDCKIEGGILDNSMNLIQSNEFMKLKKYLKGIGLIEENHSEYYFSLGLSYFYNGQFNTSIEELNKVDDEKLKPYRDLLLLDAKYERCRKSGGCELNDFMNAYQDLIDNNPNNNAILSIAKDRIKIIRYHE